MTDAKYAFVEDVTTRKRVARGAFAQKNGSKSKKCTLPSDNLTAAQRRKLSGPCRTYDLKSPTTWEDFKGWDNARVQAEYLHKLVNNYGVGATELGEMFGVSRDAIYRYCKNHFDGDVFFSKAHHLLEGEDLKRWQAFCSGEKVEPEAAPAPITEPVAAEEPEPTEPEPKPAAPAPDVVVNTGLLQLTGEAAAVLQELYRVIGDGRVTITASFKREGAKNV